MLHWTGLDWTGVPAFAGEDGLCGNVVWRALEFSKSKRSNVGNVSWVVIFVAVEYESNNDQ